MIALLRIQRTNLSRLAVAMDGEAQIESRYRRLQRFFSEVRFDYDALARLIMQLFDFGSGRYSLTLDRTNWRWGERDLNILTLAVVYKGAAIPVYWLVLPKRGNSNQRGRIAFFNQLIARFGHRHIQGLLGDREFIGQQWWAWLSARAIPFVMRMKESQHVLERGTRKPVRYLFSGLQPGKTCRLRQPRLVSGHHSKRGWAERALQRLEEQLVPLGVALNRENMQVVDTLKGDAFGFLGVDLNRNGKGYFILMTPKKKARKAIKAKVREMIRTGGRSRSKRSLCESMRRWRGGATTFGSVTQVVPSAKCAITWR